jgi:hypothetical protein
MTTKSRGAFPYRKRYGAHSLSSCLSHYLERLSGRLVARQVSNAPLELTASPRCARSGKRRVWLNTHVYRARLRTHTCTHTHAHTAIVGLGEFGPALRDLRLTWRYSRRFGAMAIFVNIETGAGSSYCQCREECRETLYEEDSRMHAVTSTPADILCCQASIADAATHETLIVCYARRRPEFSIAPCAWSCESNRLFSFAIRVYSI